ALPESASSLRSFPPRLQPLLHLRARIAHLHADGGRGVAEDCGDFVGGSLFDIAQDDGQSFSFRKRVDGAREQRQLALRDERVIEPRLARVGERFGERREEEMPAPPAPVEIAAGVDADAIKPAEEILLFVVVAEMAKEAKKRFLDGFFDFLSIAE